MSQHTSPEQVEKFMDELHAKCRAENAALRAEVERLKAFYPNAVEIAARADRYRKALEEIAKPRYGLDLTDTDEEQINHWSRWALEYRSIAAAALEEKP